MNIFSNNAMDKLIGLIKGLFDSISDTFVKKSGDTINGTLKIKEHTIENTDAYPNIKTLIITGKDQVIIYAPKNVGIASGEDINLVCSRSAMVNNSRIATGQDVKAINDSIETKANQTEVDDIKYLGWSVPKECPVHNYMASDGFHQRVGRVELGSLTWSTNTASGQTVFRGTTSKPKHSGNTYDRLTNCYCSKYASATSVANKTLFISDKDGNIYVRDTSYTDVTSFKTAMNGVYLYYELATPITMTIDGHEATTNQMLTDEYNPDKSYVAGEFFIYQNVLHKVKVNCIGVTPPNSTYYEQTSIGAELTTVNQITINTNYGNVYLSKCGKVVNIYGSLTGLPLNQNVDIIDTNIPKSKNRYQIGCLYKAQYPYIPSGSIWVGDLNYLHLYTSAQNVYVDICYLTV